MRHFASAAEIAPAAPVDDAAIPAEWTDPATGYRLIRLSRRPGPNLSFYFHNNPFVIARGDEGDQMVFYGETSGGTQLFKVNLKTLAIRQLSDRPGRIRGEIVSQKRREAFYQFLDKIYAVNIDTGHEREVATLPADFRGWVSTINSDGTLLAGTLCQRSP